MIKDEATATEDLVHAALMVCNAYGDYRQEHSDRTLFWVRLGDALGNLERCYKELEYSKLPSNKSNET